MVTPGFLPSRDTRKSLYIVGEGREQDAEVSRRDSRRGGAPARLGQNLTSAIRDSELNSILKYYMRPHGVHPEP